MRRRRDACSARYAKPSIDPATAAARIATLTWSMNYRQPKAKSLRNQPGLMIFARSGSATAKQIASHNAGL